MNEREREEIRRKTHKVLGVGIMERWDFFKEEWIGFGLVFLSTPSLSSGCSAQREEKKRTDGGSLKGGIFLAGCDWGIGGLGMVWIF